MKRLKGWDQYVADASPPEDNAVELPLTDDESYVIPYPTRRQGKDILAAQREADTDKLLIALLGEQAGNRVIELSADYPSYVLDDFLLDVMRKFGFAPEPETEPDNQPETQQAPSTEEPATAAPQETGGKQRSGTGKSRTSGTGSRNSGKQGTRSSRSSAASNS